MFDCWLFQWVELDGINKVRGKGACMKLEIEVFVYYITGNDNADR